MRAILKSSLLLIAFFVMLGSESALAGFGVTPPFVRNTSLTRNSIYEQQILLVRADPDTPLQASITVDAPEIFDWIEIVEGESFELPRGEQKVPMTVRVTVPEDAEFKNYTGAIRIKTGAIEDGQGRGAVNISLGAQIDIELNVIDREILDFRVRKISASDLNEGHKLGWLFFPGKIPFNMMIENTGNVDNAPSRVEFQIYDSTGSVLLEETKNKGRVRKIKPYATEDVTANIPTRLPAGAYLARYKIYNGDEIKQEGDVSLSILPYGTLQTAGFGFSGLSLPHKLSVLLPVFGLIILVLLFIQSRRQRRYAG